MSSKENITREGIVASTPQYCNDIAEYGNSEIQTDAIKIQNIQKYVYIYDQRKLQVHPNTATTIKKYSNI